ncbi:Polysaccharide deacetylase [Chryseobacterium sp. RU37D]|uniref:polysaccharide deacetylase family protein n=1 Tax=Chryseobacterium sp. RU37D TaxID=1907397 RepID=UPI00095700BF|nr:polysaccharide deacetylase family protein [Chryseobacterium sp. RU37D]SIP99077.1 Polysaccharide deacetylase [Chryseobacterium sp. RU37D]
MILYIALLILIVFLIIEFRLYLFLFPKNRLIILMYHQVEEKTNDNLTVSLKNLELQLKYLIQNKYKTKFFSEINPKEKNTIILTFDDGYKNNFKYLPPLLEKYNLKATIFIPTKFIQEGYKNYEMMSFEDIRNLNENHFEIALHSHEHHNFRNLSTDYIKHDLENNMQILDEEKIKYSKVLAYPYGKYPKINTRKKEIFSILCDLGINFAVRIGNKVNYFPTQKPYELCRIDIKGKDTLVKFKLKLIFGKLKLF